MSARKIADRYASALAVTVETSAELEEALLAVEDVAAAIQDHPDLRAALQNPAVPVDSRAALLEETLTKIGGPAPARNLLRTMLRRGRIDLMAEIAHALRATVDARLNRVTAEVTSATELSDEQRARIEAGLARYSGKTVQIDLRIDPEIIGGVIARVEGTVIDGSLRSRLHRIRESLLTEESQ